MQRKEWDLQGPWGGPCLTPLPPFWAVCTLPSPASSYLWPGDTGLSFLQHVCFPESPCEWADNHLSLPLPWHQYGWSLTSPFIGAASPEEKTRWPSGRSLHPHWCPPHGYLPPEADHPVLYFAVPFSADFSLNRILWFHFWASHRFMSTR